MKSVLQDKNIEIKRTTKGDLLLLKDLLEP